MDIRKFDIFLADLTPRFGTEPDKTRPVVVIQTDLLNGYHPSTIICPVTTQVIPQAELLRVHITGKTSGLKKNSDILIDQVRAIDNRRFIKKLGTLTRSQREKLLENLDLLIIK